MKDKFHWLYECVSCGNTAMQSAELHIHPMRRDDQPYVPKTKRTAVQHSKTTAEKALQHALYMTSIVHQFVFASGSVRHLAIARLWLHINDIPITLPLMAAR